MAHIMSGLAENLCARSYAAFWPGEYPSATLGDSGVPVGKLAGLNPMRSGGYRVAFARMLEDDAHKVGAIGRKLAFTDAADVGKVAQ